MDVPSFDRAWREAFGVFWGAPGATPEQFLDFFVDAGLFIDEDVPFVLDKRQFVDHVGFHMSGIWDFMHWRPRDVHLAVIGETGRMDCAFALQGKPRDAGFRQRFGICTLIARYDRDSQRWQGLNLHMSALQSHVDRCAPT
jgi:hypothetical protein